MTTVTISLPDTLKTFIDEQVASRGFGNVSEYFRSLLREAQQRDADTILERLLLEGLRKGGENIPLDDTFWKELKSEAAAIADRHQVRRTKTR